MKEGDLPHYAHQNVREFPDWYKPYSFNYSGNGWLALGFGGICFGGWTYINDIKEMKGRKSRKAYPLMREDGTTKTFQEARYHNYVTDRLEAGDPNFTKFLEPKLRASAHH